MAITPADADAATDGDQVALSVGANTITVKVTKADTTSQVYTIKVTRIAASDASLSGLSLSAAGALTLSPAFSSGTTAYTASVANGVEETTVTATPTNSGVTLQSFRVARWLSPQATTPSGWSPRRWTAPRR